MRWLTNAHVRRYHQHYHTYGEGHVYQGRFKSFIVQEDEHLLMVLRYVEANALRAKLAKKAQFWHWTSACPTHCDKIISDWPIDRPSNWQSELNRSLPQKKLEAIRQSIRRGRPLGDDKWLTRIVKKLKLEQTLRPRGRPRKAKQS
jgi:putative transposase